MYWIRIRSAFWPISSPRWRSALQALAACQRAIQFDPVYESAYREAMEIAALSGNRADVVRWYEACQKAMRQELDLPVSAETQTLYERLLGRL